MHQKGLLQHPATLSGLYAILSGLKDDDHGLNYRYLLMNNTEVGSKDDDQGLNYCYLLMNNTDFALTDGDQGLNYCYLMPDNGWFGFNKLVLRVNYGL